MNLLIKIISLLILMTGSAAAQSYVFANGGYNMDVGGLTLMVNGTSDYRPSAYNIEVRSSFEKIDASFGGGRVIGGGVGRHWNALISTEIAAEMHFGGSYTGTITERYYVDANTHGSSQYPTTWTYSSWNIIPSLLVRMAASTVSPFVRIGAILSFQDIEYRGPLTNASNAHVFSGSVGYGMIGAIGASVQSIGGTELWMDFHYASANWSPTKEEYTDLDGVKRIIYLKDSYTEPSYYVGAGSSSITSYELSRNFPMTYFGLNAGIRLNLGSSEPGMPE